MNGYTAHPTDAACDDCGTRLTVWVKGAVAGYGSSTPRRRFYHLTCDTQGCVDNMIGVDVARQYGVA